ncbi:flagellar hook-associated protein FlgK [Albibacillus kandeliae]|uniref:flagellar hook-associated protein FlgK n=1 Tax=Albibacillus kandeliae TaxID=2174228 RepID=UPI000D6982EC|nr:flagellar hook-associated protein FlgK [Albibacillus kandeliae]
MTLSLALHAALSGLTAASRASGVVSENIANALTPGYARRSIILDSQSDVSPGVRVLGIERHVDPGILANRRDADATLANAQVLSTFHSRLGSVIGDSTDENSLAARLAAFDNSLIAAASLPSSVQRLDDAVLKAKDLAQLLNEATDTIQSMRSEADRQIDIQVDRLNEALIEVRELNTRITATISGGGATASLMDQRQALVDEINEIAPINMVERDHGQIALYTDGGVMLLDGLPATITFSRSYTIVAEMTLEGGGLSGLEMNGRFLRTDSSGGALRGGSLAALFELRDELSVETQAELDSLARDLVERFEDAGLDSTRATGDPGLFTDNGDAFDPTLEVGLAGRIAVNGAVDTENGGASWRLRDGLGAISAGPSGDATLLQSLQAALSTARAPGSGNFGTGLLTADQVTASFMSGLSQQSTVAEQRLAFASASQTEMQEIELAQGVDTDAELARLMLIEQAYAANARMFEVVDELMQTLLRL